ncbi:MAG: C4-type zinc ribbon domain-containing protein [Myxococcota bacterium]
MAVLTSLLELQDLDLASDGLVERRRTLPERAALLELEAAAGPLAEAHAKLCTERSTLERGERDLEHEVEALVARTKEVETTLYSGTVRASKELANLQLEIESFRHRQADVEGRELALLEEIEQVEGEIAGNLAAQERRARDIERCTRALLAAERSIDTELAELAAARASKREALPAAIVSAYEKLRGRATRLAGRVVARLESGGCSGCHLRLPVLDHHRMQAEPADALLTCAHCGRILVRDAERSG